MKVFTTYMNCIVDKDSVTFCNLFALDSVSFYGVNAMASYNEFIKKYPKAQLTLKDKIMNALFSANDEHITPDSTQKNG